MRKTTVKKHKRRIGRKNVKVKRHNRRVKSRIDKRKRKMFTALATLPYETGGPLDIEYGDLQNAKVHFGTGAELEFDWDPDYEVDFHTHPSNVETSIMPSYEDMLSMKLTNEKEQLIFHKGLAISIAEKEKFNTVKTKDIKSVSDMIQKDYKAGMSDEHLYKKYKPIFKKQLGLSLRWHKPDKTIHLESEWV